MKKLYAIGMFVLVFALMPGNAFPQTQYLMNGMNPLPLNLETSPPNDCATVTIEVDPGGIINTPLITGGCWIIWDTSQVSVANLVAADSDAGGPWDSGFTYEVPDADGPGTYMLAVGQFGTVAVDNPLPICDIEFCCEEPGQSQITISTIPGFETIVGDTTVWDPQVADGVIDLTQIITPCRCDIAGPNFIVGDPFETVTVQYEVSSNQHCINPSEYVWGDTCVKGDVDQNGLFTVPPSYYYERCEICVTDTANTDINTGEIVQSCLTIDIEGYPPDTDGDGFFDSDDNCPEIPNGFLEGTCTTGTVGESCDNHGDCGIEGYCSRAQEDSDEDGLGDVCDNCPYNYNPTQEDNYPPPNGNGIADGCDCEGDFDCDGDCDGTDASKFKIDFGRSAFENPCVTGNPCNGDFDCDRDCDGTDAALFKQDFGRSGFNNPCPACTVEEWCVYP